MNMARTLLKEKCLSNIFWAEAVACSFYLLNRSPTTSLQMKVPQEAWSGTKLNVAHLRTFGCIAYAHIPSELRKKLDDRSEKCIFTGYSETSKAYMLYNPLTKKLILSRDVQFLENQFWNDSENQKWTVKIHCCQVLKTQKIHNIKYLKPFFQECKSKENQITHRITQLPAENHSLNHRIRELEV
jgi:hypothetical protein